MIGVIFAAGVGSRLKPFTDTMPKALVKVNNKPLLLQAIEYLTKYKVHKIVINVHHFPNQIIAYCKTLSIGTEIVISDERDLLCDTGGGLKKMAHLLKGNEPIVVVNADILLNLPLNDMISQHKQHGNLATLAIRDRKSSRKLLFDNDTRLSGWKNLLNNEEIHVSSEIKPLREFAFSGLQILSPEILNFFPDTVVFPIIPWYLNLAKQHKIEGYLDNSGYWFDIGSAEKHQKAEQYFKNKLTL